MGKGRDTKKATKKTPSKMVNNLSVCSLKPNNFITTASIMGNPDGQAGIVYLTFSSLNISTTGKT